MIDHITSAFWIFLPAGIANMAPPLANKIPGLNQWKTPLDFGKNWHGKRVFGDNKTWRGVTTGILVAGLVGGLQYNLLKSDVSSVDTIILGALFGMILGFGALAGDAVESFFKRRAHVKPGHSWFPFDQLDYIVGGLLAISPFIVHVPLAVVVWIFLLYFGLHLAVSYIGHWLGFKDQPI